MIHRRLRITRRVERNGQVEPCLMIITLCLNRSLQFAQRSGPCRLLGQLELRIKRLKLGCLADLCGSPIQGPFYLLQITRVINAPLANSNTA